MNEDDEVGSDDDLNEPGGILAAALLNYLDATKPKSGSGLPMQLKPRFDRIAAAPGRAGLVARVALVRHLAYLDMVDPTWTGVNLVPCLAWSHPEASSLWHARARDQIGPARLFNTLKPAMLEAFERRDFSDYDLDQLMEDLLLVAVWRRRDKDDDYDLSSGEIKRALTVGPSHTRQHAAWQLWRWMAGAGNEPADKSERWRDVIGPLFLGIWPLDARLQTEKTSENLVRMALECEDAFPEAVDSVVDFLVPYRLYRLSQSLRLGKKHDELVGQHTIPFVRLANAIIDPALYPVPDDLAALLQECVEAHPAIIRDASYIRLFGLRRQMGA